MATSINTPSLSNAIRNDVPAIKTILQALAKSDPSVLSDIENGTKRFYEGNNGWEFQELVNGSWVTRTNFNIDAQSVDGYSASVDSTANTIPVRGTDGKIKGDITGNAATATKANGLSTTLLVNSGGTGATTPADARTNLGVPPTNHASTTTTYGTSTSANYGHTKLSDATDSVSDASAGIASTPKALSTGLDGLMDDVITAATNAVAGNTAIVQQLSTRVDEIVTNKADKFVNNKGIVRSVNGLNADGDGNVDVGGLPLGSLMPYTGKDVPSGFLRADGSTYTGMRTSFPEFYEWVVNSGLTVPLGNYALVEGSCGYYGLDTSTGTVRMPTLSAGVFGTTVAGQYGKAVEAGLPGIKGNQTSVVGYQSNGGGSSGALQSGSSAGNGYAGGEFAMYNLTLDASRSSTVYGKSDTVTPSHVKYPWIISVYNAAVPPSVAQANEFIELLDGKADKAQLTEKVDKLNPKDSEGKNIVRSVNGELADAAGNVVLGKSVYLTDSWVSGTSWYRKYSDGWIEQGTNQITTTGNPYTVTFHIPFTKTPYVDTVNNKDSVVNATVGFVGVSARVITSTSFKVNADGNCVPWSWYACGY